MQYELWVRLDDGSEGFVSLSLTGDETEDVAIEHFRDALIVAKKAVAEREGRELINLGRISGRPTPEETARYEKVRGLVGLSA
jgi:hypothetical protein